MSLQLNCGKVSRRQRKLGRAVASVALGLMLSSAAFGGDLFWDTNGTATGGGGATAPGTWGVDNFWTSDSAGLSATGPWVSGSNALFSAGTNVTGAYTVTVDGTQSLGTLTFQEGAVTLSGGTLSLNGGKITGTAANSIISSVISGSAGLNKLGGGTLTLTNANTYSGTTLIGDPVQASLGPPVVTQPNAGIIVISNNNALGTSDVSFVQSRINGTTVQDAYTGRLYLTNNITVANNMTLTNGSGSSAGPGQLDNQSGDNVWSGNITVAGTSINLGSGLPAIGVSAGTLRITGQLLEGTNPLPGVVVSRAIAKVGPGTLILGGTAPNNYSGYTRMFGGYLIAEKDFAYGKAGSLFETSDTTRGSGVFMLGGGLYEQSAGLRAPAGTTGLTYTANEFISTAGFADDTKDEGLWQNFGGDNYFGGSLSLANPQNGGMVVPNTVGAAAGSSMEIGGTVSGSTTTSPRNLTKVGTGTIIISGAISHAGETIVSNGTLVLRSKATAVGDPTDQTGGTWIPGGSPTSRFTVAPAGLLRFDNTNNVNVSRISSSIPVNIDGGRFELVGNLTADTLQGMIGSGLNAVGDASFTVTNPSSSLPADQQFTTSLGTTATESAPLVGGINRSSRGTMLLRGTGLGTSDKGVAQIILDDSLNVPVGEPGGTGTKVGILPFATGDASGTASGPTGFVTYGPNGVRHLDEATEYAPGIVSGSADLVNATVSAPQAVLTDTAVNSIRMTTGANSIVISDLASLSVNSGAILNASSDPASIRTGTLNFGGAEGVITTVGDMNITSVISGSNGLTKSGRGTLTLGADNSFVGPLTINAGNVVFSFETALGPAPSGATSGTIVLNGGFLKPQGTMSLDPNRGITINSKYTGFDINENETLTIGASIDGPGALTKKGRGTLVLTGNNFYEGGTNLKEGVLSIADDSQLGNPVLIANGAVTGNLLNFDGGTLRITENTTINRERGAYFSSNNGTIEVADGKDVYFPLYMVGQGNLIKTGNGRLILGITKDGITTPAQGTYNGITLINGGTLSYRGTNGLGISPPILVPNYWTLSNGGVLQNQTTNTGTAGLSAALRGITLVGSGGLDTPIPDDGTTPVIWLINQPITGTGNLTKSGPGELRLGVNNTYTGKTIITGGLLSVAADLRLGNVITPALPDALTLDGGALNATASFTLSANRGIKLGANNGGLNAGTGFTLTYGGVISGAGNLTKDGSGIVALTGNSTYSGTTAVNAGILRVNGQLNGGGDMTVNSNGTLQGTGTIKSNVSIVPGSHIAPGTTVGTLTMNGLALDTANVDIEGNSTGFDRINVTTADKFTLANVSTVNVTDLGGAVPGAEYVIIDYAGTPLADLSGLSLSNSVLGNFAISLINDQANTQVKLRVAAAPPPQWNVDADGSWGVATNWNTFAEPNSPSDAANFLGKITAPRTVTLDGAKTVNALNFNNANTYTIAAGNGGSLTVVAGGTGISVTSGNHVINAPLTLTDSTDINISGAGNGLRLDGGLSTGAGATLTKKSDGTLRISGTQSYGAGSTLRVQQGKVILNSNAGTTATAASAAGANLAIDISNGGGDGSIVLNSHQDVKEASVHYGDPGLQGLDLNSPTTSGAYNALRIYAADVDGTKIAMSTAIHNAEANPGDGVFDSGLASHPGSKIGVAVLSDVHGDNMVMVRTTRDGDLNLDGGVTISDFLQLASNFNSSDAGLTWQEGDLNGDHSVTISDFLELASNFGGSYSGLVATASAADIQTLASFAESNGIDPSVVGSAVPEPGTLGLLAVGAIGLMARRRRK